MQILKINIYQIRSSNVFTLRNSGTSRRSATRPLGETQYPSVALGNVLCARTLICAMIASALGCWLFIEQPQGSWMEMHPAFQHWMSLVPIWRRRLCMGAYGAPSEKPTWLYSSNLMTYKMHFSILFAGQLKPFMIFFSSCLHPRFIGHQSSSRFGQCILPFHRTYFCLALSASHQKSQESSFNFDYMCDMDQVVQLYWHYMYINANVS